MECTEESVDKEGQIVDLGLRTVKINKVNMGNKRKQRKDKNEKGQD